MAVRCKYVPTDHDIDQLLATAPPPLAAAICLMSDAGCRLREALAYDPSSRSAQGVLRIYATKSRRWRSVPIPTRLDTALLRLARARARAMPTPRDTQRALDALATRQGVEKTSPHRLRHSYATRLYRAGIPIHVISSLLGHSKLSVTLLYVHSEHDDWQRVRSALDTLASRA